MKRLLLLATLLLPASGFSQSESDQKQKGLLGQGHLSVGINGGGPLEHSSIGVAIYVTPRVQYFLKDGWALALELRRNVNGEFLAYMGIGLSTRYYFVRASRFALFGQLGGSIGRSKYSTEALEAALRHWPIPAHSYERAKAWQATASLGAHLRLAKNLSLEVLGERAKTQFSETLSYHQWQGSVGMNILLK